MSQKSPSLQSLLLQYRKLFNLVGSDINAEKQMVQLEYEILKRLQHTHPDLSEEERINMMIEFAEQ